MNKKMSFTAPSITGPPLLRASEVTQVYLIK